MNARSLRRLAADHASLHTSDLPPNYLFMPGASDSSDLTSLDILLAGPTSTPYESGVFKLHLSIPETYPTEAPKAFFRTKIYHPNVDESTGAVCVETLKRDWSATLTIRDVLVTISCLLVQPNASSALNADAGMLLEQGEDGWAAFEKKAAFLTRLHASVPRDLKEAVREAQSRGGTDHVDAVVDEAETRRKRKRDAFVRAAPRSTTPVASPQKQGLRRPFVTHASPEQDDVFGSRMQLPQPTTDSFDTGLFDQDQENDAAAPSSPIKAVNPIFSSPIRHGPPVPLGELQMPSPDSSMEEEYPPSPKKSPRKPRFVQDGRPDLSRAESSRTAELRQPLFAPIAPRREVEPHTPVLQSFSTPNLKPFAAERRDFTPPNQLDGSILGGSSRLEDKITKSTSKAQAKAWARAQGKTKGKGHARSSSIFSTTSQTMQTGEHRKQEALETRLWELCGQDVERWNRGDFGGFFEVKAGRW